MGMKNKISSFCKDKNIFETKNKRVIKEVDL